MAAASAERVTWTPWKPLSTKPPTDSVMISPVPAIAAPSIRRQAARRGASASNVAGQKNGVLTRFRATSSGARVGSA